VEWSWRSMLEAFHWLMWLQFPWQFHMHPISQIFSLFQNAVAIVWGQKSGQIITVYWARKRNRKIENHVWTLLYSLLSFYVIYTHLCIFSMPSAINIWYKRKVPIRQQLITIIIIYGEKMPVILNTNHTWCLCLKWDIFGCINQYQDGGSCLWPSTQEAETGRFQF
jgi:hypothetical protein